MKADTPESGRVPLLEALELEVEAEAREFARRRLQERVQQLADQHGEVSPWTAAGCKSRNGAPAPCAGSTARLN